MRSLPGLPVRRFAAVLLPLLLAGIAGRARADEASRYGVNAHTPAGAGLPVLLDETRAAHVGWVRIDFTWSDIEATRGSYDWSVIDALAAAAAERGLEIYASVAYTPPWATDGPATTGVPRNAADWAAFCGAAASRYAGKIRTWGLWNEPNLAMFWSGTRQQYIDVILKPGADAIHAANPNARVAGPELAHLKSGGALWYRWLPDVLQQAGSKLDLVTHHVYDASGADAVTSKLNDTTLFGTNPAYWDLVAPSVREVLQQSGWFGRPFWLTETGWPTNLSGEAFQAANVTALLDSWFTGAADRSWMDKVFFYELVDDGTAGVDKYGLLRPDLTEKPAYGAYRDFIAAHTAVVPPAQFYTLRPCRVVDTRDPAGPTGGQPLQPHATLLLDLAGTCGIPFAARSVSANVTAVAPAGSGSLGVGPAGLTAVPGIVAFSPGRVRANNARIALAADGSGRVAATNDSDATVHLVLDVNGTFE